MITHEQMQAQANANPANRAAFDQAVAAGLHLAEVVLDRDGGFFARRRHRRALSAVASTGEVFVNRLVDSDGNPLSDEDKRVVYGWLTDFIQLLVRVRLG
ncbi:hypothetical protein [Bradyrhizobium jicamae]|uniref:hypothetical protein n=1 Tax=Bradyrhizobium jicamae TaxID=280332 RepID=UPI001BAC7544|nr:hypothetical protein [Bradyrhizobium jicamae]MBR0934864.1 hypothetical protein [Bradyrhizobium jicamae]